MCETRKKLSQVLRLRISYYPTPYKRKLLISMCHLLDESKTDMIDILIDKHISKMSDAEKKKYLDFYNSSEEIKNKEGKNYIND